MLEVLAFKKLSELQELVAYGIRVAVPTLARAMVAIVAVDGADFSVDTFDGALEKTSHLSYFGTLGEVRVVKKTASKNRVLVKNKRVSIFSELLYECVHNL